MRCRWHRPCGEAARQYGRTERTGSIRGADMSSARRARDERLVHKVSLALRMPFVAAAVSAA
jgi:hypothetical protein